MEPIIEKRVNALSDSMVNAGKYRMAWMFFTSYYCTNHKVEYNGVRMTLEEMVWKQWVKEIKRLDMRESTKKDIDKNL